MIPLSGTPTGPELLRRLRAWPVSGWEHGTRIRAARHALQSLATLSALARGEVDRPVPELGPHALADQLQVLADDALDGGADPAAVAMVLTDLARDLGFV